MIEVVSEEEAKLIETPNDETKDTENTLTTNAERGDQPQPTATDMPVSEEKLQQAARHKRRVINVALVGNPL